MTVLLEREYINNSRGFNHRGILIFGDGLIAKYNIPTTHRYQATMDVKISYCQTVKYLNSQEILELEKLLSQITPQKLIKTHDGHETGSTKYYGYLANQKILLAQEGEYQGILDDNYAQLLVNKLKIIIPH